MSALLEVRGVSFSYRSAVVPDDLELAESPLGVATQDLPKIPVLKDLWLQIRQGEMLAIQGPSGSGKSTLLYLLGLLSNPDSGSIRLSGREVTRLSETTQARLRNENIGFVFQQFHLLPHATVLENILLPAQYASPQKVQESLKGSFSERAVELATLVGLGNRLNHRPNQLSGGQQQRVAICRALICEPDLILADEPTGNLDSASSEQILSLLGDLNRRLGKTIVIITHDSEVAKKCDRVIRIRDGKILGEPEQQLKANPEAIKKNENLEAPVITDEVKISELSNGKNDLKGIWKNFSFTKFDFADAFRNLKRQKVRTALTMIGVSVGVAAVLSLLTLGEFTKEKILSSYTDLGVNTVILRGYRNWDRKATDFVPKSFDFFGWRQDLEPLKSIFPVILRISPMLIGWDGTVQYGGKIVDDNVRLLGGNEETRTLLGRKLLMGRSLVGSDVEHRRAVCVVGFDLFTGLFRGKNPIGETLLVSHGKSSFTCKVVGVFAQTSSTKDHLKPNGQVMIPYTYFQGVSGDWWAAQIHDVLMQIQDGEDVEKTGKEIKAYFQKKYGLAGSFRIDSDSQLLSQMQKFLSLFTFLLAVIAAATLSVGGVGIANMMFVSVSERIREIGLRKAVGASNMEIRRQFMIEASVVCGLGGALGLVIGFFLYHLGIWGVSQVVNRVQFAWMVDWSALFLSVFAILGVGVLSGFFPALKAERLQVIEALRSE